MARNPRLPHDGLDPDDELDEPVAGGEYRAFMQFRQPKSIAHMLALQRAGGDTVALSYSWLAKANFDPGGKIELEYAGSKATLEGRHLGALFVGITRHLVFRVVEADAATAMKLPADATVIERSPSARCIADQRTPVRA